MNDEKRSILDIASITVNAVKSIGQRLDSREVSINHSLICVADGFLLQGDEDELDFTLFWQQDSFSYADRIFISDVITEYIVHHSAAKNETQDQNMSDVVKSSRRRKILVSVFCIINESYLSYIDSLITESGHGGD